MAYRLHQLKIDNSCSIWPIYVNGPLIAMGADWLLPTSCMVWCMNYANSLIYRLSMTQENISIIDLCKNCSHVWSIPVIGLSSMQSGPLIVCTGFCDGFWILLIYSCLLTSHECLETKWMQQLVIIIIISSSSCFFVDVIFFHFLRRACRNGCRKTKWWVFRKCGKVLFVRKSLGGSWAKLGGR
jgi:hypothetical protein